MKHEPLLAPRPERERLLELFKTGRLDLALLLARELSRRYPEDGFAHKALGTILMQSGQSLEAVAILEKAIALGPCDAESYNSLGLTRFALGQLEQAQASYAAALALCPDFYEALNNQGLALKELGRLEEARESFVKALKIAPNFAQAHNSLGNLLKDLGRLDEARQCFELALQSNPHFYEAQSNLLFCLTLDAKTAAQAYLSQARAWEARALAPHERQAARETVFQRAPREGRRLKIGYLSGDFRRHPVGYFMQGILANHDRQRFEVFAYSSCPKTDAMTQRLRALAEHWTRIEALPDSRAALLIREQELDVLIDLSGHTAHNRLRILALRAAPLQAHYLGFVGSTGIGEMDYYITDSLVVPPHEGGHFSERLWRLKRCYLAYQPDQDAPEPLWNPDPDGLIWFGSFNNLYKIGAETIELWAQILRNCPQGRLLLKNSQFADPTVRESLTQSFAARGVSSQRLRLLGPQASWSEHMALYNRLDLALDPVGGLCGLTTTCDALWMGLPVLALEGTGLRRRISASILGALGREVWLAPDNNAYVETALALAADTAQRRELRRNLRGEMAASELCDSKGLARALEEAYLMMFDLWRESRGQA